MSVPTSPPEATGDVQVIPRIHESIETEFLSAEVVLLNTDEGTVFQLNSTASAVWLLIDGERSVGVIANELADLGGVGVDDLLIRVVDAIRGFSEAGLLEGSRGEKAHPEHSSSPRVIRPPKDP